MCWLATQMFRGQTAPTQAREFGKRHLQDGLSDAEAGAEAVADSCLVISELATNAVTAGSAAITITVELHRTHIYLAVRDDARGAPVQRDPPSDDPQGRGLKIVNAVARSWGTQPLSLGKRVWAIVTVAESATRGMDCVVSSLV